MASWLAGFSGAKDTRCDLKPSSRITRSTQLTSTTRQSNEVNHSRKSLDPVCTGSNLLVDALLECLRRSLNNKELPSFSFKSSYVELDGTRLRIRGLSGLKRVGNAKVNLKDNAVNVTVTLRLSNVGIEMRGNIKTLTFVTFQSKVKSIAVQGLQVLVKLELPVTPDVDAKAKIVRVHDVGNVVIKTAPENDTLVKMICFLVNSFKSKWISTLLNHLNKIIAAEIGRIYGKTQRT